MYSWSIESALYDNNYMHLMYIQNNSYIYAAVSEPGCCLIILLGGSTGVNKCYAKLCMSCILPEPNCELHIEQKVRDHKVSYRMIVD